MFLFFGRGNGRGGDVPTADEFPSLEGLMSNITRYIEFTFVVEARKKLTLVQHITSKHQEYYTGDDPKFGK